MSFTVTALVLLAAVLHAAWNALVRAGDDRLGGIARLALTTSAISVPLLLFFPPPSPRAWAFLGGALVMHTGYWLFLGKAYEAGALAKVYPIARGTAPLIVTIVGASFLGERLAATAFAGIALLIAGIVSLAWRERATAAHAKPAIYALITSLFIAGYTLLDGLGGRTAQSPSDYVVWLFFLNGFPIGAYVLWRRGAAFLRPGRRAWPASIAGAVMSFAAYWIVIWAMKSAPLGPVAALRETSVVFAVVISGLVLKEALTARVYVAAIAVVAGIALLRL